MRKITRENVLYSMMFTKLTMRQLLNDKSTQKSAQDVIDLIDEIERKYIKVEIDKFVKDYVLKEGNQ